MGALEQARSWPVSAAAVAVADVAGAVHADGPDEAEFAWASVTKLLTALAVLDAVAEGLVSLQEAAGPAGSTVRHLLAHASGLAADSDAVMAAPGTRRIYSNRGFEVLADHVAARAGVRFETLVHARVCEELGLGGTRLAGSPAHGARGPLRDLVTLGGELLSPTLLPAELAAEATRTAFPGLAGVLPGFGRQDPNDWGLGFEIRDGKSPHWTGERNSAGTFGHFGRSGSFLWVDHDAGLACACLTNREFGPWAAAAWPQFSDAVLTEFVAGA